MKKVLISLITMILLSGCAFNPMGIPEWIPAETVVDLNIRTGPGVDYEIVCTLSQGEIIEVSREAEGVFNIWRRIRCSEEDSEEYWVCQGTIYNDYFVLLDWSGNREKWDFYHFSLLFCKFKFNSLYKF